MPLASDAMAAGIAAALARLRRTTGVSVTFSGRISDAGVLLDRFDGEVVGPLRGVQLDVGHGLGGRVATQARALAIPDYIGAPGITHDYDAIIRAEALHAMAAVPVIVARRPVAVLYAALRISQREMGRLLDAVTDEARNLEQELAVGEVLRRLHDSQRDAEAERIRQARLADAHARLRVLAHEVDDPVLHARILETADLLTDPASDNRTQLHLTRREHDVLALLSAGLSNQAIADRLGIGVYTVKGHLKSLYVKLHVEGRLEAVTAARRLGLTP
ncbi:helix-turn-helix transcriptional regulator [Parafrankia sp. EUN1f]|uniref:helix-turn-helix domain-containing protein n=1 Tax=Parafrankia sp. EUN1f TaxID=102897 RepID=UPI0001C43DDF|nr:helix-turn-helix transcriptional regulator [Parafrankia sp. EUN1f]EFC85741.1 transcriptional regulator, LuxR family [Parafrankia sp. EUN1f]